MSALPKKTRLIDIAQKLGVSKVTVAAALSANPNGEEGGKDQQNGKGNELSAEHQCQNSCRVCQ